MVALYKEHARSEIIVKKLNKIITMFKKDITLFAASAIIATSSNATKLGASNDHHHHDQREEIQTNLGDYCCEIQHNRSLDKVYEFCLDQGSEVEMQSVYNLGSNVKGGHTVRCGIKVDAAICQPGHSLTQEDGLDVYKCQELDVVKVGARQKIRKYITPSDDTTIMVQYHPWVAKSQGYIDLSRQDKSRILWDKITEDATMGPNEPYGFFKIDLNTIFDYKGDEYDCRYKTTHGQGNVGKVAWVPLSDVDHEYTGLYKSGGDTGYIRTSLIGSVNPAPEPGHPYMLPSIALKFLRDGIDSTNTVA